MQQKLYKFKREKVTIINKLLKISEFAHLSGISRKTLIYYDDIGILRPEQVLSNGYRYYSYHQLETVSVIGVLQEFGMSLKETKRHLDERTPKGLIELFNLQKQNIEQKILRLNRIEAMISARLSITHQALEIDPSKIKLEQCEEEVLFSSNKVDCKDNEDEIENQLKMFYDLCKQEHITYGYSFGTMVSHENLINKNFNYPSRFFFKISKIESSNSRFIKPAGLYIIGYDKLRESRLTDLYNKLFDYINSHKLKIIGHSFEEYLLDEISVNSTDKHLLQVSIQVE